MKNLTPPLAIGLFAAGIMSTGCSNQQTDSKENKVTLPEKPNIVLLITDDVAFEHWGCYGGTVPTPNIDKLASEGMIFHNAYVTSATCTPSRFATLTGQYPGRCIHEEFKNQNPETEPYLISWNTPISNENNTLHKAMNNADYYTGFIGKFHIGTLDFDNPDHNKNIPRIDPMLDPDNPVADSLLKIYSEVITDKVQQLAGADYADAIQWKNPEEIPLKQIRHHNLEYQVWGTNNYLESIPEDKPFFLTINSTALHGPNHYESLKTDPAFSIEGKIPELRDVMPTRQSVLERLDKNDILHGEEVEDHINHYNSGIIYMDDQVGAIMELLENKGLDENTLVIITADHNIEPGKATIYEKGVKVPFLAWWPGVIAPGSESHDRIQFVDFLPTFAALSGETNMEDLKTDGVSFHHVFKNPSPEEDERMLYFEKGYLRGISNGKYKYIAMRFPESIIDSLKTNQTELLTHMGSSKSAFASISMVYHPDYYDADQLYNLHQDPYEQNNLANDEEYSDVLKKMQEELAEVLDTFEHPYPLADKSFAGDKYYREATQKARELGTDWIYWWNRKLDYPPAD